MLNVNIRVHYEGDWTAQLGKYDVYGQFLASSYRDIRYLGIARLTSSEHDFEDVVGTIRGHKTTKSLDIIRSSSDGTEGRRAVTLLIRGTYTEYTPMQILLYEGYLPFGAFGELQDGDLVFDLLVEDRDSIAPAVEVLRDFGTVSVNRISKDYEGYVIPSATGWQNLLESFSERQSTIVHKAIEMGYYRRPRDATLQDVADEIGITKTTISQHLRKAEERTIKFVAEYIDLSIGD